MSEIWLPIRLRHIRGRDDADFLSPDQKAAPFMDVTLEAGDILYLPRGCIHGTSTPAGNSPSVHLTMGMETLWDYGLSMTWESFLGAGDNHHQFILENYYRALGQLTDKDLRFRESLPRAALNGDPPATWKEGVRDRLRALVDEMVDHTPMIGRLCSWVGLGPMRWSLDADLSLRESDHVCPVFPCGDHRANTGSHQEDHSGLEPWSSHQIWSHNRRPG